jgi:hypothetical protein
MALLALDALFCAGCCVYTIIKGGGSGNQQLPAITCLFALIATAHYVFKGHKKSAANAFKIMLGCCALASLMCLVPLTYNLDAINNWPLAASLCAIGYALCFGAYLILALVPNLGKARSYALIAFAFLVHIAVYLFIKINRPAALGEEGSTYYTMRAMRHHCMFLLDIVVWFCDYFKYRDKAARGSK